jgi:hypothetical protein
MIHADLEEEVARLRQEKEQLSQQLAGALESGRRAGEELGRKDQELSGNGCRLVGYCLPLFYAENNASFRLQCSR